MTRETLDGSPTSTGRFSHMRRTTAPTSTTVSRKATAWLFSPCLLSTLDSKLNGARSRNRGTVRARGTYYWTREPLHSKPWRLEQPQGKGPYCLARLGLSCWDYSDPSRQRHLIPQRG